MRLADELQQPVSGAVPANAARAELRGHEVRGERLANGPEYALVQAVDHKQEGDDGDILG